MDSVTAFLRANLWLAIVIVAVIFVLYQFVDPAPPKELTIATGQEGGRYYQLGEYLQRELKNEGITLKIVETAGSGENMEQLNSSESEVAIAFVQSGMKHMLEEGDTELRSLGSLYYEPIWLFYRQGFALNKLTDLRGSRVAIGEAGSGTQLISRYLFAENGLHDNDLTLIELDSGATAGMLRKGEIDAAFFTVSPQSDMIQELISLPGVDFVDIKRSDAYTARYPFLSSVNIAEGLLSLERNIPDSSRRTLASTATLVVNERFHPSLTPLVLESLSKQLKIGGMLEQPNEFPSPNNADFELTKEADHFYEYGPPLLLRYLPFWAASLVDRLVIFVIPLLVVLIPLSKLAGPVYRWRIRSRIYRWYRYLLETDRQIAEGTLQDVEDVKQKVRGLADELASIEVPLSYADELYQLKQHVEYIDRRLAALSTDEDSVITKPDPLRPT